MEQQLEDGICLLATLQFLKVQEWLVEIQPLEQLLDIVLHNIHLGMWTTNSSAIKKLVEQHLPPSIFWPIVYSGIDVMVNCLTLLHLDWEGVVTFYDHLLSLGGGHNATLDLDDFDAHFAYGSCTSIFLTGRVFLHSALQWSGGERIAIAHYSKDNVHDYVDIPRPALPIQLGWWALHSSLICS